MKFTRLSFGVLCFFVVVCFCYLRPARAVEKLEAKSAACSRLRDSGKARIVRKRAKNAFGIPRALFSRSLSNFHAIPTI